MAIPEEEEESGEGWIVSFADLMTLLFATFVVLYGLKSEGEPRQVAGAVSSIREAFLEIPDVIPDEQTKGPTHSGRTIFQAFRGEKAVRPLVKQFKRSDRILNQINTDKSKVDILLDQISRSEKGLDHNLRQAMNADFFEKGFKITLQAAYFFKPGGYRLKRDARKRLRKIGKYLKNIEKPIVIEGHTDASPTHGELGNYELGALRAGYAAKVFIKEVGMSSSYISTASYADTRPTASNKTEEGRRQNRRIEIKVSYEGDD